MDDVEKQYNILQKTADEIDDVEKQVNTKQLKTTLFNHICILRDICIIAIAYSIALLILPAIWVFLGWLIKISYTWDHPYHVIIVPFLAHFCLLLLIGCSMAADSAWLRIQSQINQA